MLRPFPFDTPVSADALIDRGEELRRLHLAAADRVHLRVSAPRRYGKTSLLLAHEERLTAAGWRAVHVDFYGVTSLPEVCSRIVAGYRRLADGWLRAQLVSIGSRLGITVGTGGVSVSLAARGARQPPAATLAAAEELLELPVRLHARDGAPTLVVFDEFQDLLAAGSTLDGLVRSHVQYHGAAAVYVYAGSHPSLMQRLFTDRERPLFGQAEPLALGPLPGDDVLAELHARFAALDEDPGEALGVLVDVGAGHPQRTMLLAHLLHRALEDGSEPTHALADQVVATALEQTSEAHEAVWNTLAAGKKAVLAALADGMSPTGTHAASRHRLSRATLQSALADLVRDGHHLVRADGGWRFVDPLLAIWVASRGRPARTLPQ